MPFDTFDARLKAIANSALAFCKSKYGASGLRTEEQITPEIGWRPTFHFRPSKFVIVAAEVADNLYPEALKVGGHDILHYDGTPISVYQVCSLQVYQSDPKQAKVGLLLRDGFGIITVDDDGKARCQHTCIPLTQHISEEQLESELRGLNNGIKVKFKAAHRTYLVNAGQGLQEAGQIVEAMVRSVATQAARHHVITASDAAGALADAIDALYAQPTFKNHRAALGGARSFTKEFRNIASHPRRSAREAAEKIKKCKVGFLDGINVAGKLRDVAQQLGYTIRIHTT
jgi:hypothetical protein